MKNLLFFTCWLLIYTVACTTLEAQQINSPTFVLQNVDTDSLHKRNYIKLNLTALQPNGAALIANPQSTTIEKQLIVQARSRGEDKFIDLYFDRSGAAIENLSVGGSNEKVEVLFLLDVSGSMWNRNNENKTRFEQAKDAIKSVIGAPYFNELTSAYLITFGNKVDPVQYLTKQNYQSVIDNVPNPAAYAKTELHRSILDGLKFMQSKVGKKVIILLSDGQDEAFDKNKVITQEEVFKALSLYKPSNDKEKCLFYAVGITEGGKQNEKNKQQAEFFLQNIIQSTPDPNDRFRANVAPDELKATFDRIAKDFLGITVIRVSPPVGFGDKSNVAWEFKVSYTDPLYGEFSTSKEILAPLVKHSLLDLVSIFWGIIILLIVVALLLVIAYLVEYITFKQNYVKPYKPANGVISVQDPGTRKPINPGDSVVEAYPKCYYKDTITWNTWKQMHYSCVDCARISNQTCPHQMSSLVVMNPMDFFKQRGRFKTYNWILSGAIGGWIAWIAFSLLFIILIQYKPLLTKILNDNNSVLQVTDAVYANSLIGIAIGLCVTLALAIVEELGQSRNISITRVILRTFLGAISGICIGFIATYFVAKYLPYPFIGSFITWSLLGSALGAIITIKSSIQLKSGVIGGLIGGIVSSILYFLISEQIGGWLPYWLVTLRTFFALSIYGGTLGGIMCLIIATLEEYELAIISPSTHAQKRFLLSNWLKSPHYKFVTIGTEPKSLIMIKWKDDFALPKHALLQFDNQRKTVYLIPIGVTCINGRQIQSDRRIDVTNLNSIPRDAGVALKNGDIIQIGLPHESITKFQFIISSKPKEPTIPQMNGTTPLGNTNQDQKQSDKASTISSKPKIVINVKE